MIAWHAAAILQPHLKKGSRVSAADLLGEGKQTAGPMTGLFLDKESVIDAIKAQREARQRARDAEAEEG